MARAASRPFVPSDPSEERGRGARSNRTGRYELDVRVRTDDGWPDEARAMRRTVRRAFEQSKNEFRTRCPQRGA